MDNRQTGRQRKMERQNREKGWNITQQFFHLEDNIEGNNYVSKNVPKTVILYRSE